MKDTAKTLPKPKPKDGFKNEAKEGKPPNTWLTVGSIRIPVKRDAYLAWEAALRAECEFNGHRIAAEIRRRLAL